MNAFIVSLITGLCGGIGAIPIIFLKRINEIFEDTILGFAAGVMTFAGAYSLILPCIEDGYVFQAIIGILIGAFFMYILEKYMPDDKASGNFTLVLANIIHNIPEGFVIGAGYEAHGKGTGILLAIAIGMQNIPEGLIVSNILLKTLNSKIKAVLYTFLIGFGEPISAGIGILALEYIKYLIPFSMAFAGGSILYVVSNEMIPKSHCRGNEKKATFGFILGFIFMIFFKSIIKE
ncbi:ZIP family metal transporter [Tepidibacter thalassicus]|uniref:Zinc transporter, ZIP family n=1 Tax=Tepidibacter thalassicus DSM 15285 TaxID=1123350 RepID=A0A1M5RQP7_9FIRM|nr:ZIP family metal transporter [Tepidibacter thalassicus]SHH28451.1 zinc transporter, ZIP family [Tepidibacter thalassicus DSM 15285]